VVFACDVLLACACPVRVDFLIAAMYLLGAAECVVTSCVLCNIYVKAWLVDATYECMSPRISSWLVSRRQAKFHHEASKLFY
jgi:hypothetical protein